MSVRDNRYLYMVLAADRDEVNAKLDALGWGPENFTIPIGAGRSVTHYGACIGLTDDMLTSMQRVLGDYTIQEIDQKTERQSAGLARLAVNINRTDPTK